MGIFTELGLLYAKFKAEKLMEHLKLFGKRVNIPRLIRVCEEQEHWKELVYLYIQVCVFGGGGSQTGGGRICTQGGGFTRMGVRCVVNPGLVSGRRGGEGVQRHGERVYPYISGCVCGGGGFSRVGVWTWYGFLAVTQLCHGSVILLLHLK
jgi:hypothetical protein